MELFPYEPRPGQEELIALVRRAAERGERLCVHAPTGFGKTPAVLAGLLQAARTRGLRILWAVRTGNETDRPIEELKELARSRGIAVPALSIRGKRDMCLLGRRLGVSDYAGVSALCRLRRRDCPYFSRLTEVIPSLDGPKTFSEVLTEAKSMGVCPYFYQLRLLEDATLVSLSYNYVLGPTGRVLRRAFRFSKSILVVDEAHNIPDAACSLNSDSITLNTVDRAISEIIKYFPEETDLVQKVRALRAAMEAVSGPVTEDSTFSPTDLLVESGVGDEDLERMASLGEAVYRARIEEGKVPRSYLHRLAEFLSLASASVGEEGVAFLVTRESRGVRFEVWDMRAPEILGEVWPSFRAVVLMSGTLAPVETFAEVAGLEGCSSKVFPSMADPSKVVSLITAGLTTRGEKMSEEMVDGYVETIGDFISAVPANVAVFSASYRIQGEILPGLAEAAAETGRRLLVESEGMTGDEAARVLAELKSAARSGHHAVLVAPMGGRFAEGADLPGEELAAVFLVGIPFDRPNTRTRLKISYYSRLFPGRGRFIAYVVPALRRASQALGRVIRSRSEGGAFVLGDERYSFRRYFELLPDYVRTTARVVRPYEVGDEVRSWSEGALKRRGGPATP